MTPNFLAQDFWWMLRSHQRTAEREVRERLSGRGLHPPYCRSQNGEDLFLLELFNYRRHGYFLEAGAGDGRTLSITHALEAIGWKGLLIEPVARQAEVCQRNRPNSQVVQVALTGATGEVQVNITRDAWGGLLSHVQGTPLYPHPRGDILRVERVPATTLDAVLEPCRHRLDVLILDLEGLEPEVLQSANLARHAPTLLMVEDLSEQTDSPVAAAMAAFPDYLEVGRVGESRIYFHRTARHLSDTMRGSARQYA